MTTHHKGIHHITVNGGDPQNNAAFYIKKLGIRLVKKSVNQDATDTYHFFYSNAKGAPGSNLSFFPWKSIPQGRPGVGQATVVSLAVPSKSKDFWEGHLSKENIHYKETEQFGKHGLRFEDPDGLQLELVFDEKAVDLPGGSDTIIPEEYTIRGVWGTTLELRDHRPTAHILKDLFGFEQTDQNARERLYQTDAAIGGSLIIREAESGFEVGAKGTVHHVAFRAKDKEEQELMREKVLDMGLYPSPIVDRHWFHSMYFKSPGGVLFEIATDGLGFTVDETPDKLGESLVLAPWLESQREEIEKGLPEINV